MISEAQDHENSKEFERGRMEALNPRKTYHGWVIVEEGGKGFKDYIFVEYVVDGVRHRKEMESRGQTGAAEAVEWWDKRLGQPAKLEKTLKGMYRVYTEVANDK